ncbi:MAG: signal peptidase II, partial [Kiritimatiellae bacterium]|nr:signal peptidase II [Kiritimatiellia bacterium]
MKRILTLAAAVLALDQAAKFAALRAFGDGSAVRVVPDFFDLRLVLNDGAAWGMLAGRQWLLVAVSAAMLAVLWWNRRDLAATRLSRIAAGLLAG